MRRLAAAVFLSVVAPLCAIAVAQTGITGVVREDSTGRPVAGADVSIEALKRSVKTDNEGRYRLIELPDGLRMVTIRKVGYSPVGFMAQVVAGEMRTKDLTMERSTPALDTVRVRALSGSTGRALAAFEEHRARGFGKFIDSTALKARASAAVPDFLRDIPSVYIRTPPQCGSPRRDNCVYQTGYRVALSGNFCAMQINFDGTIISRGGKIDDRYHTLDQRVGKSTGGEQSDPRHNWTSTFDLSTISASSLIAVEVYPREADIPFDMHNAEQECGLLVMWSNR